jgi:hypothetical protein
MTLMSAVAALWSGDRFSSLTARKFTQPPIRVKRRAGLKQVVIMLP